MPTTKPAFCINSRRLRARAQKGDALLEALIGFMLLLVLGLGLSYAAARALHVQRFASTQSIALNQMRGNLQTAGLKLLCKTPGSVQIGTDFQAISLESECRQDSISVGVAGNAALSVSLPGTSPESVVTRMRFATSETGDSASGLLGDGAIVMSQ